MENVEALIDAIDTKGDKEAALKEVAKQIINNIRDNDVEGIGAEVTEILKDKIETNLPVPSKQPKDALIKAEKITVSVPKAGSAGTGTVTVTINNKDTGGGTIVVNGTSYPCVINDDGTITLTGAGNNGGTVVIGSIIDDDDRTVTLTNLDKIANAGLEGASNPSPKNSIPHGKPEFEDGFIDDSISESDLTLLVMTLILAKIEKVERVEHRSLDEYLTDWTREDTTKDVKTGAGLDDDELLIASIVNFMIDRGDDMSKLTNMIKDLLGVK
jgi:hypothetical protein